MAEKEVGMAKAPLICKKLSAGSSAEAIGKELDRRAHIYNNTVDPTRTHLNLDYVRGEDGRMVPVPHARAEREGYEHLEDAIERRMGELHTKRKIRSDAVKAEGMVISTEGALPDEDATAFLAEAIDWMGDRYGQENLLAASIHMDEDVPHAQIWIAPVIHDEETGYDRLSAKELFTPNRVDKKTKKVLEEGTLGKLQREFYEQVAAGYGFERPFTSEQRYANGIEYKSQPAFKAGQQKERLRRGNRERGREVARAQAELRRAAAEERAARERNHVLIAERDEARKREREARERERAARERNRELRERAARLDAERGRVEERVAGLAERVGRARGLIAKIREVVSTLVKAVSEILADLVERRGYIPEEHADVASELGFGSFVAVAPRSAMGAADWARGAQLDTPAQVDLSP